MSKSIYLHGGPLELSAAAESGPRRASAVLLSGLPTSDRPGWLVDIAGIAIAPNVAVRHNHDLSRGAGHAEDIRAEDGQLLGSLVFSRATPVADEILASADRGYPWRVSVGLVDVEVKKVGAGQTVFANGRSHIGPLRYVTKSKLVEVSLVDLGRDEGAYARFGHGTQEEDFDMDNEPTVQNQEQPAPAAQLALPPHDDFEKEIKQLDKVNAKARSIKMIAREYVAKHGLDGDMVLSKVSNAITEGMEVDEFLAEMRALARPSAKSSRKPLDPADELKLCAAQLLMSHDSSYESLIESEYGEHVAEAVSRKGKAGPVDLSRFVLERVGISTSGMTNYDMIRLAMDHEQIERHARLSFATYSTISLPSVLAEVANKSMMRGWTDYDSVWSMVCRIGSRENFDSYVETRLAVSGPGELPEGDEVQHIRVSDSEFTGRLRSLPARFRIPYEQIASNNTAWIDETLRQLGRNRAMTIDQRLGAVMQESSDAFYTTTRNNRITSSPLNYENLAKAITAIETMKDEQGNYTNGKARYLVVPPAMRHLAVELCYGATMASESTGSGIAVRRPVMNVFTDDRYRIVPISFVELTPAPTTWYLLADQAKTPAFAADFLRGVTSPQVSRTTIDGFSMEINIRIDYTVRQVDWRGAVKATP